MKQLNTSDRHTAALLGIDLGSVNLHCCTEIAGERITVVRPLQAAPLQALGEALADAVLPRLGGRPLRAAVTGQGGHLLSDRLELPAVNEVMAVAAAVRATAPQARTVLDLGGQISKWIRLDGRGRVADFATNGLCAAGSGAFLEQQASRLELSVAALGTLAAEAEHGATVAGRCAVFAKSDMIHLQQKGTPLPAIAYGLCQALARTFLATVVEGRALEPPVAVVGGGAANPGLLRALVELTGLSTGDFVVPDDPFTLGALGAMQAAATAPQLDPAKLQRVSQRRRHRRRGDAASLPPLRRPRGARSADEAPEVADRRPRAVLGVDVGSVSTNLALTDEAGELLFSVYLRTRGRPLEALAEGLRAIRARFPGGVTVLAVGSTGSGRHLAARVLGADVVRNEITAQHRSAAQYVPEVDTIFEIGGQDSKYIGTRRGLLSGFEMNKICAAGTGSFLEEQAEGLGISIFDEFAALAFRARAPRDLGTRCTVFMDAELRRAQQRGAALPDLCAGLAYSVARNYLEKVVGGRPVGRCVVFQGGTASNQAVVAAMTQILGRPVQVHPYNRVSGALGAALLAADAWDGRASSRFRGLQACGEVTSRSFECQRCTNRCQVNRLTVDGEVAHFGDTCERYTERDARHAPPARPFPELFAERARLFDERVAAAADRAAQAPRGPIGLLRTSTSLDLGPLLAELTARLGYRPEMAPPTTPADVELGSRGIPAEVCLPVKAAAGQARAQIAGSRERPVLAPSITDLPCPNPGEESATCFLSQEWVHMLPDDHGGTLLRPMFGLGDQAGGLVEATRALAACFGRSRLRTARELWRALQTQQAFQRDCEALGTAALEAEFDRAVVVFGRPYNLHDPFCNLGLARHLDRLGLPAIPLDLLPLDDAPLDERWYSMPWHYPRQILRALSLVERDERLFPVVVSSFGCGVDGMLFKHLEELLGHRPHLLLEFDEHRAEAGLVTRLEAFRDEIDDHLRTGERRRRRRGIAATHHIPSGRRIFMPCVGELSRIYAGAFRAAGYESVPLGPPSARALALGEEHASGRECHPYVALGGQLWELLEQDAFREGDVYIGPSCEAPCLLRGYGDGFRATLKRLGHRVPEVWDFAGGDVVKLTDFPDTVGFYTGATAVDMLTTLCWRVRPYARDPQAPLDCLAEAGRRLERAVEEHRPVAPVLHEMAAQMWALARDGRPGDRPVVGVTGDVFTRIVDASNGNLFYRLQDLGLEVWPSPFFAMTSTTADFQAQTERLGRIRAGEAARRALNWAMAEGMYFELARELPSKAQPLVTEPTSRALYEMASPYVGLRTNWLIWPVAAKLVDFLRRGASGAITAAGVNCMIGTAAAGAVPAVRRDNGGAPVISLIYGNSEGPTQRIKIETFAEQVIAQAGQPRGRTRRRAGLHAAPR